MDYKQLIIDTGRLLGLEDFEPDDDGFCCLISEEADISIMHCPEPLDMVLVTAPLRLPDDALTHETTLRTALKANHMFQQTHGATLSLNEDDHCLQLTRYLPLAALSPDAMLQLLNDFATALVELQSALSTTPGNAPDESQPAAPDAPIIRV